ncbi:hypothetical protein IQ238_28400 [Pleurocapsales cyanobacterium LEGE 06147]|nr:hypothetical protein [Pleurocapsales cyanobacterium LEGE 06147]
MKNLRPGSTKPSDVEQVKHVVNNSNYGAETKVSKLAPIVKGWRNYHKHCKMDGSRFNLWQINNSIKCQLFWALPKFW